MDTHIIETREFNWKLNNFTNKLIKVDKVIISEEFSVFLGADETKWRFNIDFHDAKCGSYLYLKDTETDDFTVNFEGFVLNLTNQTSFNRLLLRTRNEFKIGGSRGWKYFISIDEICKEAHNYLKDNTLTLGLKVELTKKKELEPVNIQSGSQQYLQMCKEYFDTKLLSDFTTLCSDGIELQAYKFILAAFSPVMKAMIVIKIAESKSNKVKISDIDGETMTEILRFIYTLEVNLKELAIKLLYGAEKYKLTKLTKLCVASMIENLTVQNAVDYFLAAIKYNSKALIHRSAVFIKL